MDPETLERLTLDLAHRHDPIRPVDPGPYLDAICEAMGELGIDGLIVEYHADWPEVVRLIGTTPTPDASIPDGFVRLLRTIVYTRLPPDFDLSGSHGRVVVDPRQTPRARFNHVNPGAYERRSLTINVEDDPTLAALIGKLEHWFIEHLSIRCGSDRVTTISQGNRVGYATEWSPLDAPPALMGELEAWFAAHARKVAGDARNYNGVVAIDSRQLIATFHDVFIPVDREEAWLSID